MKLSGVSISREYTQKNFKFNVVIVVILSLKCKALYFTTIQYKLQ